MPGRVDRMEVGAVALGLTVLGGEWVGHTLECARVEGLGQAFSSVHVYMGPLGLVLAVTSLVGVAAAARLAARLERRLTELRRRPRPGAQRAPDAGRSLARESRSLSVATLAATVWVAQCLLYVLQENLEAASSHRGLPLFHAVAGAHTPAPLVHLAVALVATALLWLTRRKVIRLAEAVRTAEAAGLTRDEGDPAGPLGRIPRRRTPRELWGAQSWSRPPPARVLEAVS